LSKNTRIDAECMVVPVYTPGLVDVCRRPPMNSGFARTFSMLDLARRRSQSRGFSVEQNDINNSYTPTTFFREMNTIARTRSKRSELVFMLLPTPRDSSNYVTNIRTLVEGLPPTILVGSGRRTNVIPQEL